MFEKFSNFWNKKSENEMPDFTKGVHSILCYPLKSGLNLDLKAILEGKEDAYRSNINYNEKLFFNNYDEFKSYLSSNDWRQSWQANLPIAVFFLGCSRKEAPDYFKQNKFSELVIRASHLDDLLVQTVPIKEIPRPRLVENERFNSYVLSPSL